ncbi:MAG: Mg2+ and Co2+ transporter CorB [Clostridia bacterium]|nr:Mg2+ and Co2+ transporter CorB [Clostridia bacterium]
MDDNYKHPADERKVRFRLNILNSQRENRGWSLLVTVLSFIFSILITFISYKILGDAHIVAAFGVVLFIIIFNIIFDIIGTAVTAADEAPFHAMASRKLYGARQAIKLIRNADKVSNFCNDVIGDISGVISGTATTYIIIRLLKDGNASETSLLGLVTTGLVAALTVGGKAVGKTIAIANSNYIIYKVAVVIKLISLKIDLPKFLKRKKRKKVAK